MGAQISDLTATDRLRTGTQLETQDPVNGSDFDTADALLYGVQMDTPSQIIDGDGNIMEVEAHTLAARMRINPDETNFPQAGWNVGRYLTSNSNFAIPSISTALARSPVLMYSWAMTSGIAVIKKINVTLALGAATAPTAGIVKFELFTVYGLSTALLTADRMSPPSQAHDLGLGSTGHEASFGNAGLKGDRQPPSQISINSEASIAGLALQGYVDLNPIGLVQSAATTTIGETPVRNASLYDYNVAEQPLILTPGTGFQICLTVPSATNRNADFFANVQWDEWTLVGPSDR